MAIRVKYYILFLLFTLSLFAFGQNTPFIEHFSIKDGLSHNGVTSLFFDSRGFLWIGTQDGLNRFDGKRFIVFRNEDYDSTSLSYNNINAINEDDEGNIWIATQDGLNKFNLADGKFRHYYHNIDETGTVIGDNIRDVIIDDANNIWCATDESLDFKSSTEEEFAQYWHYSDVFKSYIGLTGNQLLADSIQNIWLGTKDGLFYFNQETKNFTRYFANKNLRNSLSDNTINDLMLDNFGDIWLATNNGLNFFDLETKKIETFFPNKWNENESFKINALWYDGVESLWLASSNGLLLFNTKDKVFQNNETIKFINENIKYNSVFSIIEDQNKNKWLSTHNGIYKVNSFNQQFGLLNYDKDEKPLFGNNTVSSVYKLDQNNLLIGTWGTGLYLYNRKLKESKKIYKKESHRLFNGTIHCMFKDENNILLGTDNGIFVYNIEKKEAFDFEWKFGEIDAALLKDNRIYQIEKIDNQLWIASANGIYYIEKNQLKRLKIDQNDNTFYSCLLKVDNSIWIGTGKGLIQFNLDDSLISTNFNLKYSSEEFKVVDKEILSLKKINEELIIGSVAGLFKLNLINGNIRKYGVSEGLVNQVIYSIEPDKNNNIWFSTNSGITKMNEKDSLFENYDLSYGLQGHEFNLSASHFSEDGEMFFGGISGLNFFYPDEINYSFSSQPLTISSIEIIDNLGNKKSVFREEELIVVSDNFQLISIEFTSLNYSKFDKNQYEYAFVTGGEDLWLDISNKNYITLSNLTQGSYTLKLRKAKIAGSELVVKINVIAPIYRSKSAFIFYIIVGIVLFLLIPIMRFQNIRRSNTFLLKQQEVMGELSIQKEELVYKNKNITDSINYAKRIQEAIMPSENLFRQILLESFVFYQPKDIVSGDFYWVSENKNKIFVAVVDCTGHGVPGAFMSIIGIELLRNITVVKKINDAAEVLNELNKGVREIFSLDANNNPYVKDGMDVSLIVIDKENNNLQFAGALNIMYIVRDNKIVELKGERFAVGLAESESQLYTDHNYELEQGDILYLFTDGYADQFGGPEGKKYKYRRFRQLLLNIHNYSMAEQHELVKKSIEDWKGNNEQVDDILLIGIKSDLSCYFNY